MGLPLSNVQSNHDDFNVGTVSDQVVVEAYLHKVALYPGRYLLSPWITDSGFHRDIDFPRMCALFDINPPPGRFGDLKLQQEWGKVFLPSKWKVARPDRYTAPAAEAKTFVRAMSQEHLEALENDE